MRYIFRYDDFSVFDGEWDDAPVWGVQTIAFQSNLSGAEFCHQGDFYFVDENGEVAGCDHSTIMTHMARAGIDVTTLDDSKVTAWASEHGFKVASMVTRPVWDVVYQLAKGDRDSLR